VAEKDFGSPFYVLRTADSRDGVDGQANYRIREFTMKNMKRMKKSQMVSSWPS
jgi:hypothetical protein